MLERLQKIIARAGVASRRHAEQLILAGQVTVNGEVVTELGSKADPERDSIKVAGKLVRFPETKTYVVLNKPTECVSTMSDPEGRRTLRHYVQSIPGRIYPVGRLDYHSEGLVLLTNDGELAHALLCTRDMPQTYWIKVKGSLDEEKQRRVQRESGARLRLIKHGPNPWYEVIVREPRRDALRRSLVRLGHPVEKMKRVAMDKLELGMLTPGEYRHLSAEEVQLLRRAATRAPARKARKRRAG